MSRDLKPPAKKKLPYHKGHLREKLLREAARIIAKDGAEAVSLRKLGERLGISRMAAYHHFDNKDDLLAAVGQDGFRRLSERLQAASLAEVRALEGLRAALLAYVRFAREEPEFFRLMFANLLDRPVSIHGPEELHPYTFSSGEAFAAFDGLLSAVKRWQSEGGTRGGDPLVAANTLWAFAHGVACLTIDDHLKIACPVDEFLSQGFDVLVSGLSSGATVRRR
jgi:AcrR family transcriptional regulator